MIEMDGLGRMDNTEKHGMHPNMPERFLFPQHDEAPLKTPAAMKT